MLVFVLLGVTLFDEGIHYDFYLIAMTSIGCVLSRGVSTFLLSFLLNIRRPESDRISFKSQIILWNAGLRGAVAYALAVSHTMPKVNLENTKLMITTVHAAVLFTIFFHGLLTVPIVGWTGLAGAGASVRQLSEPRPARKKLHSWWSMFDKTYIIPFISLAHPSLGDTAPDGSTVPRLDENGIEIDERESFDMPRADVELEMARKAEDNADGGNTSDSDGENYRRRRRRASSASDTEHDDSNTVTLDLEAPEISRRKISS